MVVHTSALIAILTGEKGSERLVRAMDEAESLQMSGGSVLEVSIVLESRYGEPAVQSFDRWLQAAPIEIAVLTRDQVDAARERLSPLR